MLVLLLSLCLSTWASPVPAGLERRVDRAVEKASAEQATEADLRRALAALDKAAARFPDGDALPRWRREAVVLALELGDTALAVDTALGLSVALDPTGAWWGSHDEASRGAAVHELDLALRKAAVGAHQQSRTDSLMESFHREQSRQAYAAWLARFPASEHWIEMQYAYGELRYAMQAWGEALAAYDAVVEADPQGKHARFCAESAVFAAIELMKAGAPDAEASYLRTLDRYVARYPDDEKTLNMAYRAAYFAYERGQVEEAARRFWFIIRTEPQTEQASMACDLMVDSFVLAERWEDALAFADEVLELGVGAESWRTQFSEIRDKLATKVAQEAAAGE